MVQKADNFKHNNRSNLLVFSDRNSGLQLPERAVAMAMQISTGCFSLETPNRASSSRESAGNEAISGRLVIPHGISGDLIA